MLRRSRPRPWHRSCGRMLEAFLQEMEREDESRTVPGWNAHLPGTNQERVSLTVTRNWRLTFRIDRAEGDIVDLDYEDYH